MSTTTLNLSDLRTALTRTIDSVAELLGDDVAFDRSMYWKIESTDAFDLSTAPAVDVGSLGDDIEQVRAINVGSRSELTISPWHDLDHLISVLSRLSMAVRD